MVAPLLQCWYQLLAFSARFKVVPIRSPSFAVKVGTNRKTRVQPFNVSRNALKTAPLLDYHFAHSRGLLPRASIAENFHGHSFLYV